MRHWLLKFNHGVEIGAYMAYVGHVHVTKDPNIAAIAREELDHREVIRQILKDHNETPSVIFDGFFTIVGTFIQYACLVSPKWSLDFIARVMEIFAVINYTKLSKIYGTEYVLTFIEMAKAEERHRLYFEGGLVSK